MLMLVDQVFDGSVKRPITCPMQKKILKCSTVCIFKF